MVGYEIFRDGRNGGKVMTAVSGYCEKKEETKVTGDN